jgi:Fe-S cluster assembly iron-binding protein IscA
MLIITDKAKQYLKKLLISSTSDLNLGVRLSISKDMQLGVLLDHRADDDHIVVQEGVKVLIVNPDLLKVVDGMILDTEISGTIENLVLRQGSH